MPCRSDCIHWVPTSALAIILCVVLVCVVLSVHKPNEPTVFAVNPRKPTPRAGSRKPASSSRTAAAAGASVARSVTIPISPPKGKIATQSARPISDRPTADVTITASLDVSAGAWRKLEAALDCWANNGAWTETTAGHWRWEPDSKLCPPYAGHPGPSHRGNPTAGAGSSASSPTGLACAVMQSIAQLMPQTPSESVTLKSLGRHRVSSHSSAAAPASAVFVGDSVTEQYYRTFAGWAFPSGDAPRAAFIPLPTAGATQAFHAYIVPARGSSAKRGNAAASQLANASRALGQDDNIGIRDDDDARTARDLSVIRPRPADGSCPTVVPLRMDTPLAGCRAVSALFRRSDRLLLDGDARAECLWTSNFIDAPWSADTLSPATRLIVLNRGAHDEGDALTMAGWADALREVRRAAPNALVAVRTTPGGHYNCEDYDRPIASPLPRVSAQLDRYKWGKFSVGTRAGIIVAPGSRVRAGGRARLVGGKEESRPPPPLLPRPTPRSRTRFCGRSCRATSRACCCLTSKRSRRCGPTHMWAGRTACTGAT